MTSTGAPGNHDLYSGACVGGPLDGQSHVSRFPKGILAVDRPANKCWVYEWDGSSFRVRDDAGAELVSDEEAPVNRWRAAIEPNYDVIAVP